MQTLIDEVCQCCFSAYCSRANKTTRRLFSRDPAYRKPIRRRAVLNHDCYSFSDERREMKRSDLPLLNADGTLRQFSTSFCRDQTSCISGDLHTSKSHPHQPALRLSSFSPRQACVTLDDRLKRRALWQYAAGAPCTCQDDHTLSLPSGPHARWPLLVSRIVIFQSTTDQRAQPVLVEQQGHWSLKASS